MATTNYTWNLPTVGGSEDTWGTQLNQNWSSLDTLLGGVTNTEFAILDGATISTTELNYLSGATGNIQSQIDSLVSSGGANDSTITIAGSSGLTGGGSFTLNQASAATITLNGVTQGQSTWEAGTSTTESVVSPAKIAAAISSLASGGGLGNSSQNLQFVLGSRSAGTTYQNSTGSPIWVGVAYASQNNEGFQWSPNGSTWYDLADLGNARHMPVSVVVPPNYYYRIYEEVAGYVYSLTGWSEYR